MRALAFGLAVVLALAAARSTPAFYVAPPAPGQQIGAWFPRNVQIAPLTLARDASGRFVVGGGATFPPAPTAAALVRFTASGLPDPSFGAGGVVTYGAGNAAFLETPLADGRALVATQLGRDVVIERRLADGSADPAYPSYLWHSTNSAGVAVPLALAVLPDGTSEAVVASTRAMVVVQGPPENGGLDFLHFSGAGALLSDASFTAPEWVAGGATAYTLWNGAHVFPDGSVVAAGYLTRRITPPCPCDFHEDFVLRRFLPTGAVDTSFGAGGRVETQIGHDAYAGAFTVAPDGRLFVAGTTSNGSANTVAVASYGADGMLKWTATGPPGNALALAVGADGSVFAGSREGATPFLLILAPDGTTNRVISLPGELPWALSADVGGGVTAALMRGPALALARFAPDGTRDPAFGGTPAPVGPPPQALFAVAVSGDTIAAAGVADDGHGRHGIHLVVIANQLITGAPPVETTAFVGDGSEGKAVAVDSAGRVVVGGVATPGGAIVARFAPGGSLDPAFGTGGVVTLGPGAVTAVAVLPDDRIVAVAGDRLYRLSAAGAAEPPVALGTSATGLALSGDRAISAVDGLATVTVDAAGVRRSDPAVPGAVPAGVAAERDGTVVVAGNTPAGLVLTRRSADGTVDRAFGTNGVASLAGLQATGVALQRDGRVDVAVRDPSKPGLAVARFNYDGRIDATFGTGGLTHGAVPATAAAIAVGERGIAVAGSAPATRGTDSALARLWHAPLVYAANATLVHVTVRGSMRIVGKGTQPAWSRAGLAYVTDDDEAPAVAVKTRLVARSPLSGGLLVVGVPRWSPDGALLALQLLDPDGTSSIGVVPASGGAVRRIDAGAGAGWLSVHRLAYVSGGTVRLADADTGVVRTVTSGLAVAPAPKGSLLAVLKGGRWAIVRTDGTTVARLPKTFSTPAWAPDGRRLAGFDRHCVAIVDTRGRERLTQGRPGWEARGVAWSPDGRTIAWVGRARTYGVSFVDAGSGRVVGRWVAQRGFAGGNPAWDTTGVYITVS